MKSATYRIASDHRMLPLIDWYLYLFDLAAIARRRFFKRLTCSAIRKRLLQIRGAPGKPDITRAAALLDDPRDILRLHILLATLRIHLDLPSIDPLFPWCEATQFVHPIAHQILPWRIREEARFLTCAYKDVPWASTLAPIQDHFAHLSTANPGLIAFTETNGKGEADIQTPMKPGRYLAKFYPHLADHHVRDLQETMPRTAKLHFAISADDIERVYTCGPSSCMSHDHEHFDSPWHPVRVYGDSDLQLAYIKNKAGLPTARALVWPAQKRFGRIYGHETLLRQQLEREGYVRGELIGARIRRINIDATRVVMPYIDDEQSFDVVDDEWLCIGGPYEAQSTAGLANISTTTRCASCEDRIADEHTYTVGDEHWCESCRDNYAFTSAYSCDDFPNDERVDVLVHDSSSLRTPRTEAWSTSERDAHATYCDGSEEWYATDQFTFVRLKNGQTWLASYFADHGDPADLAADNDNPQNTAEGRAAA